MSSCGSVEQRWAPRLGHLRDELTAPSYLVGQPHRGLAMFTMMNSARIGVGMQGLGLSERALQNALRHARERPQSRSLRVRSFRQARRPDHRAAGRAPDAVSPAALVEGGRALAYHAGPS